MNLFLTVLLLHNLLLKCLMKKMQLFIAGYRPNSNRNDEVSIVRKFPVENIVMKTDIMF